MPLRFVAIGDSLSEGVGDTPWPDGSPRGWTDRLAGLLAAHHGCIEYANLAVRGLKSAQIVDTQTAPAHALGPDLLTVSAGMNDLLRPRVDFAALQDTLVRLVEPFSGTPIVFVPIPDVSRVSPVGRLLARRRLELNAIYRYLAEHYSVLPVTETAGTVFEDPRGWADDRLHLSPLGHERLAQAAAASFGLPVTEDWAPPPAGPPPRTSFVTEAEWTRRHVLPWVGRRVRGRSSGDGHSAKLPNPRLIEADPAPAE